MSATRQRVYWLNHLRRAFAIGLLASLSQLGYADADYAAAWGPGIGSTAPLLAANDQTGNKQTLDTLTGPNGLLFIFNRSVDW